MSVRARHAARSPLASGLLALTAPLALAGLLALAVPAHADEPKPPVDPALFKEMKFRNIGPFRGGRVTAVTGVPGRRDTFFMGSTGGGVWKTTDGGTTWRNVSDKDFKSASVGALAVAPSDINVVYAGMGSACPRGNVSPGDGIYRSTDGGESWKHAGLADAGQIGRIRVHPANPDEVFVAVLGHAFGPSAERGVYRSRDGGATWKRVLFVSDQAGAVDLAIDPSNPRILYAAIWRAVRQPWEFVSGGEGSGLHKTTDGGETWKELKEGLPAGVKGRIGVAVSGANPSRVWALVEAEDGGLFRSDDGGGKFTRWSSDRNHLQRAWYYTHIFADPRDANTLYSLNVGMWRSDDGGKDFQYIRAPHGDHHDLWINPDDPQVMINGNDGGANVSYNGGRTWSSQANQPTGEFYRVIADSRAPYHVYGCQQDNTCVAIASRGGQGGIQRQDWYVIGGCESGHVAVDPLQPLVTYSGCYGGMIGRYDHATGQEREVMAWPQLAVGQAPRDLKYRFQWNAPILFSPHEPSVLYHTSQYVHRTTDGGQSWQVISPDLTRNDPSRQSLSGGPITKDNTGAEVYGTIFALAASALERGLMWAGSDDGRVHLTRDGGATWNDVTPKKMPEWGQVNSIEASPHAAGRVFLAVTRYKTDDFAPYIFRSDDYGATWHQLTDGRNGIPASHFVRVVREDPARRGLLYAGTEFGLYISFDDGRRWQPFQQELPITPVTDLFIKGSDLVAATQGRSFWILDDLTPLHRIEEAAGAAAWLFQPRDAFRGAGGGGSAPPGSGANPPAGAVIAYALAKAPGKDEEVTLEIRDADGRTIRRLSSLADEPGAPDPFARFAPPGSIPPRRLAVEPGMNRFVWDLRLADATLVKDAVLWGSARGPRVAPGRYQARLQAAGQTLTREFSVGILPGLTATRADLDAQFDLSRRIWMALSESHAAIEGARDIRTQIQDLARRAEEAGRGEGLAELARPLTEKLTAIEQALYQTKNEAGQDILNFTPRLDNQFVALMETVASAEARPTDGAVALFGELRASLDRQLADLRRLIETDLAAFNAAVRSREIPPVIPKPASPR